MQKISESIFKLLCMLCCAFYFGCERTVETTRVTINFPGLTANKMGPTSSSVSYVDQILQTAGNVQVLNSATSLSDPTQWWDITPTGKYGEFNLNCFVVLSNAISLLPIRGCWGPGSYTNRILKYSEFGGPTIQNKTLTMEAVSGKDRVFYVLAMHANTELDCAQFKDRGVVYNNLSKPYLVGTSAPTDLSSSVHASVDISVNLNDLSQPIEGCDWDDITGTFPRLPPAPDHFETKIDTGIFGGHYLSNKCVPINLSLRDASGFTRVVDSFSHVFSSAYVSGVTAFSYDNPYSCNNLGTVLSTFEFNNSRESVRWIMPSSSDQSLPNFQYVATGTAFNMVADNTPVSGTTSTTEQRVVAQVPEVVYPEACMPVSFGLNSLDWTNFGNFKQATSTTAIRVTVTSGTGSVTYWSDSGCKVGLPTDASVSETSAITYTSSPSNLYLRTAYLKYSGVTQGTKLLHEISFTGAGISTHAFYPTKVVLQTFQLTSQSKLKITGPHDFLATTFGGQKCIGPYKVALADTNGVELGSTASTYSAYINYQSVPRVIDVYKSTPTNLPCTAGDFFGIGNTFSLGGANPSSVVFYIKINSGTFSTADLTQYLYLSAADSTGKVILHRDYIKLNLAVDALSAANPNVPSPVMATGFETYAKPFP